MLTFDSCSRKRWGSIFGVSAKVVIAGASGLHVEELLLDAILGAVFTKGGARMATWIDRVLRSLDVDPSSVDVYMADGASDVQAVIKYCGGPQSFSLRCQAHLMDLCLKVLRVSAPAGLLLCSTGRPTQSRLPHSIPRVHRSPTWCPSSSRLPRRCLLP